MSTLERLKTMSDPQIQNWLRTIDPEDLKKAIPGIHEEIRKCIYGNMSENAGKVLKESVKKNKCLENGVLEASLKNLEMALNHP